MGFAKSPNAGCQYEAGKKGPKRRNLTSVAKIAEDLGMTLSQTASGLVRQEVKQQRQRPLPRNSQPRAVCPLPLDLLTKRKMHLNPVERRIIMASPGQYTIWIFSLPAATAALAITFMLIAVATQSAQAQTLTVLHNFTGGQDGGSPNSGLTLKGENLYGSTPLYGGFGYGAVYQLKHKISNWIFNPIYSFAGFSDGAHPAARMIFGPNGTLYGTTTYGGGSGCSGYGCGTVFNLNPKPTACSAVLCYWNETVLYSFAGPPDGSGPGLGDLIFDQAGNIYGATMNGGSNGMGAVYELKPKGSGWTESVLYSFSGSDGAYPANGMIFDNAGNLYSTTIGGGVYNRGTVFELTPSGSGWTEKVLHSFQNSHDGANPYAGLIFDQSGNLYGATSNGSNSGGPPGGGTVFELTPGENGNWTYTLIYSFNNFIGEYQCGPSSTLAMDGAGNLYGTTVCDGVNGGGNVWELTPSGGSWTYTSLHDFTGGSDGENPVCNVVFDSSGNLYGTTLNGGNLSDCGGSGCGVVWEITP